MKKTFLSIFLCLFALAISIQAQNDIGYSSRRLSDAADRLATQTSDLSSRIYNDFRNRNNSTRNDVELVFLAQQMDSSARLFQQMVRENRHNSDLRNGASILSDLSRRAPNYGSNGYLWRDVQSTITTIQREVGTGGGFGNGDNGNNGNYGNDNRGEDRPNRKVSGTATWRGTVDSEVQLVIQGGNIATRTITGAAHGSGAYNFSSPLPNRGVAVEVNKKKGRGSVNVLQQPTRNNDFTAVIQILDKDGGAKEYQLEIYWY